MNKSSAILSELKEAISLVSLKGEILLLNNPMFKLLGLADRVRPSLEEFSNLLTGDSCAISSWLSGSGDPEEVYMLKDEYFRVGIAQIRKKGIIITATDITENVKVQKQLEQSISDLKNLTETLESYSHHSEILAVQRERELIHAHILEIIQNGMNELRIHLLEIQNHAPVSYDQLLQDSRSLLEEIRIIVSNWRTRA